MDTTTDNLNLDGFDKPKLPTFLNVLTILTFIASAIQILLALLGFFTSASSYAQKDKVMDQISTPGMPDFVKKLMGNPDQIITTIVKSFENRVPILLVTLLAAGLCIWGAIQMRGLKKQGFLIYSLGKIIGLAISIIFIGTFMLSNTTFIFYVAIALLFIGMYAANRKHLIY